MTPLYREALVNLRVAEFGSADISEVKRLLLAATVFDIQDAWPAMGLLGQEFLGGGGLGDYGFLPSPVCLFEKLDTVCRSAVLAKDEGNGELRVWFLRQRSDGVTCEDTGTLDMVSGRRSDSYGCHPFLLATLAIVNAPRGVRLEGVQAHRGQARKMRAMGVSECAFRPWTRVWLKGPSTPANTSTSGSSPKAYHFCRQHLRERLGRVELVKAHWRGDPALGIVRKTYDVAAP